MAEKIFNKIKKFIAEKKVDKNFKHAGAGHKLTDGRTVSSPPVSRAPHTLDESTYRNLATPVRPIQIKQRPPH